MTTEQLKTAILEAISRIYCKRYCGMLEVVELYDCATSKCCKDDPGNIIGYELILGLAVNEKPLRIAVNGSSEDFLKYICKELRTRDLARTEYFRGYQTDSIDNVPENCC